MRLDPKEAADLQQEAEHSDRAPSPAIYLLILFLVAFLLLGWAYFQQQRAHQQALQGLTQQSNTYQTIDQLTTENRDLRRQLEEQEQELERLQTELDILRAGE